jgi:RND family efflux transporter MFP subunit
MVYIAALIASAGLFGCSASQSKSGMTGFRQIAVKLATIKPTQVEEASEYSAVLKSRKSISLYPQIDGHITKIFVTSGDNVNQGQALIEVDPLKQQASVSSFEEAIHTAEADLETAKETLRSLEATRASRVSNLNYDERQVGRYTVLEKEGAVAAQDLDQWVNQGKIAAGDLENSNALIKAQKATILKLERTIKQDRANLKAEQVQLNYYNINAPFHGMIGDIPVKLGDYVTPTSKLTTLTQNEPLEAYVSVPTERASKLHLGMNIELIDQQGKPFGTSKVFFIAPNVDESSQSILVKSLVSNAGGELRADQLVRARVIWNKDIGLLVPTSAVSHAGNQDFVFIAQADSSQSLTARQIPVKLGDIQGNDYQVLSGLKSGDRIVTSGTQNLADGVPIAESK